MMIHMTILHDIMHAYHVTIYTCHGCDIWCAQSDIWYDIWFAQNMHPPHTLGCIAQDMMIHLMHALHATCILYTHHGGYHTWLTPYIMIHMTIHIIDAWHMNTLNLPGVWQVDCTRHECSTHTCMHHTHMNVCHTHECITHTCMHGTWHTHEFMTHTWIDCTSHEFMRAGMCQCIYKSILTNAHARKVNDCGTQNAGM